MGGGPPSKSTDLWTTSVPRTEQFVSGARVSNGCAVRYVTRYGFTYMSQETDGLLAQGVISACTRAEQEQVVPSADSVRVPLR